MSPGSARSVAGGGAARPARSQEDQAGYVLHTYPYSETSLIVETFTREHGRVPLLAKGARRAKSGLRSAMLQFQRIAISWAGRGELKSLVRAEWMGGIPALRGTALFCGFYLNELLLKLLARDDPHERLFDDYERALALLGGGAPEAPVLRVFEKALLREIGYAVNLDHEAGGRPLQPASRYVYLPEQGLVARDVHGEDDIVLSGAQALAIGRDDFADVATSGLAKQLMRRLIEYHLNGRQLSTRRIFFALQQP